MTDRSRVILNPKSWCKIASPWFVYTQVDETDAKECSICWGECTSYLHCANSEEHIVCRLCSKKIIENTTFVNHDASIDIKWKCPICRHYNEIGSWQFQAREQEQGIQARQQLVRQQLEEADSFENRISRIIEEEPWSIRRRRRTIENRLSRIDENAPSKFKWVLSLEWKTSIVNHFKAWIMYNNPNYVENRHNRPPSGAYLNALKQEHNYEERKRSHLAPWFNFLDRTTPP